MSDEARYEDEAQDDGLLEDLDVGSEAEDVRGGRMIMAESEGAEEEELQT